MARRAARKTRETGLITGAITGAWRFVRRWVRRVVFGLVALGLLGVVLFAFVNPPTTLYMAAENARHDGVRHDWVEFDQIAPVMARAVVAAEDANFCTHWGFDMTAIRQVIAAGERRGASTITQQTVKNVYLWPERSWLRKALEALVTPAVELVWSKRRILEVYLNVAEFDTAVFGIEAAAQHHFGVPASALSPDQASRLAAVLPNPKDRSATLPTPYLDRRAASIRDGAETIRRDGRAACFEE